MGYPQTHMPCIVAMHTYVCTEMVYCMLRRCPCTYYCETTVVQMHILSSRKRKADSDELVELKRPKRARRRRSGEKKENMQQLYLVGAHD